MLAQTLLFLKCDLAHKASFLLGNFCSHKEVQFQLKLNFLVVANGRAMFGVKNFKIALVRRKLL